MNFCKNCKSKSIRMKKNYTHGSKSTATVSFSCKECGSRNIGQEFDRSKGRRR